MPTSSVTRPMMPPRASISRTRCPLAIPPMAGLQDICAIRSMFIVTIAVRKPIRAQALAASQPACPAPTTIASYLELVATSLHSTRGSHMRILIIGGGGREHALCWKLAQSPEHPKLYTAPGNPGIATVAECTETTDYVGLAESIRPDLTIVGPEAPLAEGVADSFRQRGWPIVGPSAAAARIETSKAFSKTVMEEAGVPTARHITVASHQAALTALKQFPRPVVLKADGLAAGKGVIIAHTEAEVREAIPKLLAVSPHLLIEIGRASCRERV